jgi:glycosyltransferase involved in cell wall biosynthesis
MKIAHVSAFYEPTIGGVEKVMRELATRQVKEGHEVHIFVSDFDKNKTIESKEDIIDGVYVHRSKLAFKISQSGLIIPGLYKKLVGEHKKIGFDVVHSHVFGHLHFVQAAKFSKKFNVPHIHTTHCPFTDAYRSLVGRMGIFVSYNYFSKKAMKNVDEIIAITPWELNFITKYGGNAEKIKVIPNGMDKCFLTKIENNDFKEKYHIPNKLVLFFGRLNVTKGPEHFVEIAKRILAKRNDVTFVIRGPDEGMKEQVTEAIKDERGIVLLDATRDINEIIKMYQAADIYVMPSFREGLPLTLFEAMACGLPIVATPVNGIGYEIQDGINGFLIDYGEDDKFAEKIEQLLDNEELRRSISENNLIKAKDYDWDIIHQRYMKEYSYVISQRNQ